MMSHLICTSALIVLIFLMPFYYFYIVNNMNTEMATRELKEIADYVSNSFGNLYFLANSTSTDVQLHKDLSLPTSVQGEAFVVELVYDNVTFSGQSTRAHLRDKAGVYAISWLPPGLNVDVAMSIVHSDQGAVTALCVSNSTGTWVGFGGGEIVS